MLEFENVSYYYSKNTPFEKEALKNISLKIKDNVTTGIIGHTGCGKSTLAQMMNALISPTSGRVLLDGNDINAKEYNTVGVRFEVGLVFQYPEYQLFEETVYKDISFGPKNMGLSEEEIKERVKFASGFTGITDDMLERSPFEISGGQRRRVAIAGVIAMDPKILVLDEPAAGLDPKGRNEILSGLVEYRKKRGNSLVIISHSMEDIAVYSDEIIAMKDGEVLLTGTPREVFSQHELLTSSGLDIPEITSLLINLKNMGYDVDSTCFTVESGYKSIEKLFF
ncbi:MAG: energy-coupling factor transporter ATPase [Clostridiales bacterium]|nr:energy-coupling factor transporter ATPase [Clostridiales bacterium]